MRVNFVTAGPTPRKLSFRKGRQASKKKQQVLDDSDEEDADMAEADSGEDSGSVFEAQDADVSSSEDEGDSEAAASDEVLSYSHAQLRFALNPAKSSLGDRPFYHAPVICSFHKVPGVQRSFCPRSLPIARRPRSAQSRTQERSCTAQNPRR